MDTLNSRTKIFDSMSSMGEIIKKINNNVLGKEVNVFMAPHLYFEKNNYLTIKDTKSGKSNIKIEILSDSSNDSE